ncbi:MAG: response regulator [Chloroflexi bacterium]|nr:response regulator [Chloroflexota bacterium]
MGLTSESTRILVIDDEQVVRDLLVTVLSSAGYNVDGMQDARKALKALESEHYDLMLVDIQMPGMNGMEFFQTLALRESASASKVIFITGSAGEPEVANFLERSGRPVLSKPFDLVMLEDLVENELRATLNGKYS